MINISVWKGTYCGSSSLVTVSSVSLEPATSGLPGAEEQRYYVLIKAAVDEHSAEQCIWKHTGAPQATPVRVIHNMIYIQQQGKQMSVLMTLVTLIHQLLAEPEQINKTNQPVADCSSFIVWLAQCELFIKQQSGQISRLVHLVGSVGTPSGDTTPTLRLEPLWAHWQQCQSSLCVQNDTKAKRLFITCMITWAAEWLLYFSYTP